MHRNLGPQCQLTCLLNQWLLLLGGGRWKCYARGCDFENSSRCFGCWRRVPNFTRTLHGCHECHLGKRQASALAIWVALRLRPVHPAGTAKRSIIYWWSGSKRATRFDYLLIADDPQPFSPFWRSISRNFMSASVPIQNGGVACPRDRCFIS